ncbi:MAG: carboxypeptidase regulatory-like domain-containing protein [Longimicrobiales bacterium]
MRGAVPALALTFAVAGPIAAQQIRGRVVEVATGEPIADAALSASDRDGHERIHFVSDSAGRFVLPLPFAGQYTLRVEHIAYDLLETEPFEVAPGELLEVEVRLAVGVIPLDPLIITSRESQPLGRLSEFYDRLERGGKTGEGHFFGREDLERYPGTTITMLIARVPGVHVRHVGPDNAVFMRGPTGECPPAIFIDGIEVGGDFNTMLDSFTTPEMLEGVEVYRSALQTPIQYRRDTNCGAILVWSRQGRGTGPFSWKRLLIGAGSFLVMIVLLGGT